MKEMSKKKIFRSFFVGNLITLIVPIALIAALILFTLYDYFNTDITNKDNVIALNMKKNVESFLYEAVDTLEYINLNVKNQEIIDVNQTIDQVNSVNRYFENVEVIDQFGKVKYTMSSNASQIGYDRSGESYYQYILNDNGIYWSKPFISPVSGKATVTIAIAKESNIVVGYLNLDHLNYLTSTSLSELGEGLEVAIVDSNGVYISSKDSSLTQQRQAEPNFKQIQMLSTSGENHTHFKYNGIEYMAVMANIPDPDWYLIIYDDYERTFSSIGMLLKLFVALFVLFIINSVGSSSVRAYRISKFINEFIKKTETIASGGFEVTFDEHKYDEFDRLAANFKVMVENLKSRDAELEMIAYHDRLTGLNNRAYLYGHEQWKKGAYKNAKAIGLIYLDIDNFKNTNDTYGHTVGDELLIEFSKRLQSCMEKDIVLSRLGGDEFVVLIPDEGEGLSIDRTIEGIQNCFRETIRLEDRNIFVTVSMGISTAKNEAEYDIKTQLRNADTAMYVAKEQGKNTFVFYNPVMNEKINRRMIIEQGLRNCLEAQELRLVYQPLITTNTRKIAGFEALLRWNCDVLGGVGPAEFIPVAEETGLINRIGEWVMRSACETLSEINERSGTNYIMSVNVSPVEFKNPMFISNLQKIISETGIKPEWLEIEITENVFIDRTESIIEMLNLLKAQGIRLSLDDFGTGYSSMSYLKRLPISSLKIDREFIKDLELRNDSAKMVESIIILAHNLGAVVIAEGVETGMQAELLENVSCDIMQGFYFSKPVERSDVFNLIS